MTKYIRVLEQIQGKPTKIILRFNICNDCPLMSFSKKEFSVSCRKFKNNDENNIINDFVLDYDDKGLIENIPIPVWCELPKDIHSLNLYDETYLKKGDKILTSKGKIEKNLPIYDIDFMKRVLKNNIISNKDDFVPMTIVCDALNDIVSDNEGTEIEINNKNPFDFDYDRIIDDGSLKSFLSKHREIEEEEDDDDNFEYIRRSLPTTPPILVCSYCGGQDVSVNRDINNGMCETCYNTYKDNEVIMQQSLISNFRLKRGAIFVGRHFKVIEK